MKFRACSLSYTFTLARCRRSTEINFCYVAEHVKFPITRPGNVSPSLSLFSLPAPFFVSRTRRVARRFCQRTNRKAASGGNSAASGRGTSRRDLAERWKSLESLSAEISGNFSLGLGLCRRSALVTREWVGLFPTMTEYTPRLTHNSIKRATWRAWKFETVSREVFLSLVAGKTTPDTSARGFSLGKSNRGSPAIRPIIIGQFAFRFAS